MMQIPSSIFYQDKSIGKNNLQPQNIPRTMCPNLDSTPSNLPSTQSRNGQMSGTNSNLMKSLKDNAFKLLKQQEDSEDAMNRYFHSSIKKDLRKSHNCLQGASMLSNTPSLVRGEQSAQSNILDRIRQANKLKLGSASCIQGPISGPQSEAEEPNTFSQAIEDNTKTMNEYYTANSLQSCASMNFG